MQSLQIARLMTRGAACGLALMFALHAFSTIAVAGAPTTVPEIDGGTVSAGLALLSAGVLMLRARFGSK